MTGMRRGGNMGAWAGVERQVAEGGGEARAQNSTGKIPGPKF